MPDLLKDYPIVVQQELIWADMDAYQHINNAVFFSYFETARMAYFEKIGVNDYMHTHSIGPILASTTADYKVPLVYPDTIKIGTRISDIHNKKLTMEYIVYSLGLEKVAAVGSGLIVFYDYTKGRSCEIPASIVEKISDIENR